MVTGCPAVAEKPEGGMLNALSAPKTKSGALRTESTSLRVETMITVLGFLPAEICTGRSRGGYIEKRKQMYVDGKSSHT